jgi:hypothetical protein
LGNNQFTHLLAIEGPAQFGSRARFFHEAHRVLLPAGEMVLTDIVLGTSAIRASLFEKGLMRIAAESWLVPRDNCVTAQCHCAHLRGAGFSIVDQKMIGKSVFPGYAANAFARATFAARTRQRGLCAALGLTLISWFLGALYRRGLIEYVFTRARKP